MEALGNLVEVSQDEVLHRLQNEVSCEAALIESHTSLALQSQCMCVCVAGYRSGETVAVKDNGD